LAGETWPLMESRSTLRTTTFLWVDGMANGLPEAVLGDRT
jgi:hypothetical protein